jgi:hypothetical protein
MEWMITYGRVDLSTNIVEKYLFLMDKPTLRKETI